jgi:hypothetical protein
MPGTSRLLSLFLEGKMTPLLDICQTKPDGSLVWVEAQSDMHIAKARLNQLAATGSSEYFIFDQMTGQKIFLESSAA